VKGESATSRRHRLQRHGDAQLLHHIGFAGEIEVRLDRAGALHHVEAELAFLRHVVAHDLVAALRHPGRIGARPFRLEAHAEQADAELRADFLHLAQMRAHFGAGLVNVFQGRAGQFELAARLQGDAAAIHGQGDGIAVLVDRLPAETLQTV